MNSNQTIRQFFLLGALSLAIATGTFATRAGAAPGPTVTITSPKENAIVTNASLTVTGITHDAAAATPVEVVLDAIHVLTIASTNHFTNWSVTVLNLPPGTNTLVAEVTATNDATTVSNKVTFFYKLPAKLTATYTGRGSLSPNDNGKDLNINENYTIKAVADAAAGFGFTTWTASNAFYTSSLTNEKLTFQMVSNLQLTASFVDIQAPTVTITTKPATTSNSVVAITGTAKDNVGVVAVWIAVGSNGGWNLASSFNAYTNWAASVILGAGSNIVYVYAEDAAGNRSKTNSVKFDNAAAGFAPESLAGTMLQLVATNGGSAVLGFGGGSFSQMGSNGVLSGVGTYVYTLTNADTAQLATTFTAPPMAVSNGESFTLDFTNGLSGTFTDTNGDSGTFTLSDASSTAPDALSGLTLQGADTNGYQFTNTFGDGTYTSTNTNGISSGTYTYALYSPTTALLQGILTNGADDGTTNYVRLNFLTDSDTYYVESDTTNGVHTDSGTFSVIGETNAPGYTAPVSLAGLAGAVTEVKTNGERKSFVISFGPSTYGQFTANTNQDSGVGIYTYTRTGAKTALFENIYLAPPDEVDTNGNEPVTFTFTSSHSASFVDTGSGSHGTLTFSASAATAPLSLVGRKITNGQGGYSFGNGTFQGIGDSSGGGNYTYAVYGPQVAMIIMTFTDVNHVGRVQYVEVWLSTAASGTYVDTRYENGTESKIETGSFNLK